MKKIYTYILGIASLLLPSCSDYFDINTDPNNPSDVDYTTLVPTIQLYGTRALCTSSGLSNELIVYTHQFSTREEANEYGVTGADFYTTYGWQYMYVRALENLELAMDKASEANDNFTIGMLKVLKAYYYSQFVDVFGDIPFSEACKTDEGIQFPKYDKDSEIYPQLFTLLDEGIAALKQDGASGGDFDLYYGGNAAQWIKAANSIKLKLYTQVRLVQDVSAEVKALIDGGNLMASTEDGLMFRFGSSTAPDERHPGYPDSYATTQQTNHISPWFYEIMRGLNKTIFTNNKDPRIPYYFYNLMNTSSLLHTSNPKIMRDELCCYESTIDFFKKQAVLDLYHKEICWRILKVTQDLVLTPDTYKDFLRTYPPSHKYICSCPDNFCNKKVKMMMWLLVHKAGFIVTAINGLRGLLR